MQDRRELRRSRGYWLRVVNSGGRSALEASHSAQQMRLMEASMYSRTSSSNVRTFSLIVASSGMMFFLGARLQRPDGEHRVVHG